MSDLETPGMAEALRLDAEKLLALGLDPGLALVDYSDASEEGLRAFDALIAELWAEREGGEG